MTISEQTFQMLWDCKYCGQKKLLGVTHRFCASCGGPQDAAARYFPPEGQEVAAAGHVFVGADVHCAGCAHWNSRAARCCTNCGAPVGGQAAPIMTAAAAPAVAMPGASAATAKKGSRVLAVVFGIVGLFFMGTVGLFCTAMFWTKEGTVEIAGHTWQRAIDLERFQTVRASAWCDELPTGARTVAKREETRSTEKIPDGETCTTRKKDQGDGTFKQIRECTPKFKSKDVKGTRCDYDIERWAAGRTVKVEGAALSDAPRWPPTDWKTGTCLGCEREAKRTESYGVSVLDSKSKKTSTCSVPEARWRELALGSRWKASIRQMTDGVDCDSLQKL